MAMEEKEVQNNNKKIELVFPETNLEVESKFVRKGPGGRYQNNSQRVQTISQAGSNSIKLK